MQACWTALSAVTATIQRELQASYVRTACEAVATAREKVRRRRKPGPPAGPWVLPAPCSGTTPAPLPPGGPPGETPRSLTWDSAVDGTCFKSKTAEAELSNHGPWRRMLICVVIIPMNKSSVSTGAMVLSFTCFNGQLSSGSISRGVGPILHAESVAFEPMVLIVTVTLPC